MIKKLYNLKNLQKDQLLVKKQKLQMRITDIDIDISHTQDIINTATVDRFGSISDFSILEMHKNTLRHHIHILNQEKIEILASIDILNQDIISFQKETEQFDYILQQQKKEQFKMMLAEEALTAEEFAQSQFIKNKGFRKW
jgi:mevalonate pyrophosphate decarboxylase